MNKFNASPQAMLIVRFAPGLAPLHWQLFAPGEPHHEASGRWPAEDASPFPALAAHYPAWAKTRQAIEEGGRRKMRQNLKQLTLLPGNVTAVADRSDR